MALDGPAIRSLIEAWFDDCDILSRDQARELAEALFQRQWTAFDDVTAYWGIDFLVDYAHDTATVDDRLLEFLQRAVEADISLQVEERARAYLLIYYRDESQIDALVQMSLKRGPDETIEALVALKQATREGVPGAREGILALLADPKFGPRGMDYLGITGV